jgi:hypothetical protein
MKQSHVLYAGKRPYGTVFRVPKQEPGAVASCAYCPFSRFYPSRRNTRGSAVSRAKRALKRHVHQAHPELELQAKMKMWDPVKEPIN